MKKLFNPIIPVVGVLSFISIPISAILWIWTGEDWAWQYGLTSIICLIFLLIIDPPKNH